MATVREQREMAIHMLRLGQPVVDVAKSLERSERWVRKWHRRYVSGSWAGLEDRSRAPKRHGRRLPESSRRSIIQARSELEADAALGRGLKYIGGRAVRTRLKDQRCNPLPSVPTIERRLREAGLTRHHEPHSSPEVIYPHLQPQQPHQLCQIDIVPHYLTGGQPIACFNALDVVSRYPAGRAYGRQGSQEAAEFAVHVWQTIGIPAYTQVDNQDCFSGGHTHPHVLGKLVRLALMVDTELIFSPVRHPESNGFVERFHQEYNRHVWQDTYLKDLPAVQQHGDEFFARDRQSRHHVALQERTPQEVHEATPPRRLRADFSIPDKRLPLYEGRVHFMRRVQPDGTISVLNVNWSVPNPDPLKGVWATLELSPQGATLAIYDATPDATDRTCLARYPFPLSEKVIPHEPQTTAQQPKHAATGSKVSTKEPQTTERHSTLGADLAAQFLAGASRFLAIRRTRSKAERCIDGS